MTQIDMYRIMCLQFTSPRWPAVLPRPASGLSERVNEVREWVVAPIAPEGVFIFPPIIVLD